MQQVLETERLILRSFVTKAQKQAIIKGCTQLMVDILNKEPEKTFVVIDEVNTENWGIGFDQVTELRR